MFPDFNPSLFDDLEFKEDSVREVIIAPILSRLGYTPSGKHRVVRSKTLKHPFIYAGTRQHSVNIIPDYTIFIDDKPMLVIDAKRPSESILDGKNVQQAYSYAMHPEIRCQYFSLCNGKNISLFDVVQPLPLFLEKFENYENNWDNIERFLGPKYLQNPHLRRFAPDFGTALKRFGLAKGGRLIMYDCKLDLFGRVDSNLITASANCELAGIMHCVSVDFNQQQVLEATSCLPEILAKQFNTALNRSPFKAAADFRIELALDMHLGDQVDLKHESFVPLIVDRVIDKKFNPVPSVAISPEIPDDIYRLSKAYTVR